MIFQNQLFRKILLGIPPFADRNTFAKSLDPDQAGQFVGPDLGPYCLQRLSADDTWVGRVNSYPLYIGHKMYVSSLSSALQIFS